MLKISIDTAKKINSVSPLLYGIFFEDINYAGDGGLYGELIANRSFEYTDRDKLTDKRKMCWEKIGDISFEIRERFPLSSAHPNYARLTGKAGEGIRNLGFCKEGLSVHTGQTFRFSCYARNASPMRLCIRLKNKEGEIFCEKTFPLVRAGHGWSKYNLTLTSTGNCKYVYPEITLAGEGTLDLDLISLFPTDTFKGRQNGLRKDLAEMLAALHPKFMRFPGGCIVEGRSFENMYNWKDTVGSLTERPTNFNRWQMEEYQLKGGSSEDYFQSYGLGFYEYFLFCEDIGAKPVPVINAGMTCQWHEGLLADLSDLDRWIQDVCDLIEFANSSPEKGYGQLRAEMGHPEPFSLEYIGIGNEQWGKVYFERYERFEEVLSQKHPEIKLITCAGWTAEGEDFDYAYDWMKKHPDKAYAVDEHFYKPAEWFWDNLHRYDTYDRSLPKVLAGEYAAHSHRDTNDRVSNLEMALSEAAFLTGLEKNADHVIMSCYAPLFGRIGHAQWQPDLIWFDNDRVYGTPSYYVQQLFSTHLGENQVAVTYGDSENPDALPSSATLSGDGKTLYLKLVNPSDSPCGLRITLDCPVKRAVLSQLFGNPSDTNSLENPEKVAPVITTLFPEAAETNQLSFTLPPYSITVAETELG